MSCGKRREKHIRHCKLKNFLEEYTLSLRADQPEFSFVCAQANLYTPRPPFVWNVLGALTFLCMCTLLKSHAKLPQCIYHEDKIVERRSLFPLCHMNHVNVKPFARQSQSTDLSRSVTLSPRYGSLQTSTSPELILCFIFYSFQVFCFVMLKGETMVGFKQSTVTS